MLRIVLEVFETGSFFLATLPQVVTYDEKRRSTTHCEVLQAYPLEGFLREDFPSYAPGGCRSVRCFLSIHHTHYTVNTPSTTTAR
jgi:hypothetical protein